MSRKKNVAEVIVDVLASADVRRVYGLAGDSLNGLTDAIFNHGEVTWIHVRHEEVGAFAAGAEAHLTGKLCVCAGSSGPGHLHLINGTACMTVSEAAFPCWRSLRIYPAVNLAANTSRKPIRNGSSPTAAIFAK